MDDAARPSPEHLRAAARSGAVGAGFGAAALAGFRWWERWDHEQECTDVFGDCAAQSLGLLAWGLPLLLVAGWLGLVVLGVRRRWLVLLIALTANGLAAVATHAVEPRLLTVTVSSAASWALAATLATPREGRGEG